MTRFSTCTVAAAALLVFGSIALLGPIAKAQGLEPGARAGNAYVPSTHTPGCGGIMCDSDDPRRAASAPPPPPCQGLLCGVSPYAMQQPVTAGDVQRIQEERARAAAAAAPPEPAVKAPHKRRKAKTAKTRADKAKSVATRTPDPGTAAPGAR